MLSICPGRASSPVALSMWIKVFHFFSDSRYSPFDKIFKARVTTLVAPSLPSVTCLAGGRFGGRRPDVTQIWAPSIPSGRFREDIRFFSSTFRMSLFQIGAAPVTPETSAGFMGELSLFPTHVATRASGVNPMVQLSRKSSVVPVLTETEWSVIFKKRIRAEGVLPGYCTAINVRDKKRGFL